MKAIFVRAVCPLAGIMLGACTAAIPESQRPPVEERVIEGSAPPAQQTPVRPEEEAGEVVVRPLPDSAISVEPLTDEQTPAPADEGAAVNPAIVTLLNQAGQQARDGETQRAAATLERALEIEPENAWLWHRLAALRLEQGRLDEALNLAVRSNHLDPNNAQLVADNWRLIAEARSRQGDEAAAEAAAERARTFSGSAE